MNIFETGKEKPTQFSCFPLGEIPRNNSANYCLLVVARKGVKDFMKRVCLSDSIWKTFLVCFTLGAPVCADLVE